MKEWQVKILSLPGYKPGYRSPLPGGRKVRTAKSSAPREKRGAIVVGVFTNDMEQIVPQKITAIFLSERSG